MMYNQGTRRGTERYFYHVVTSKGKTHYFEHLDQATDCYDREGVKLYLVTKELEPTKALAMWK